MGKNSTQIANVEFFASAFLYGGDRPLDSLSAAEVLAPLRRTGLVVLRNFAASLDAARRLTENLGQIVNTVTVTGTQYVGYHGELTYTPFPPDALCFFCSSASEMPGGETALCDGVAVWANLSAAARNFLEAHPLRMRSQWDTDFLQRRFGAPSQAALCARLDTISGLRYDFPEPELCRFDYLTSALRLTRFGAETSFVNSLVIALHDQRPRAERAYTLSLEDGSEFPAELLDEILRVTADLTYGLRWEAGDYAIVDNSRLMHGRIACRAALPGERELVNMHTHWRTEVLDHAH